MIEMLSELTTKQKVILSIIILIIAGTIGFYTYSKVYKDENKQNQNQTEELKVEGEDTNETNETKTNNTNLLKSNKEEENITVHIIGEVKNKGVYTLKKGSRITDVIKLAGGSTDKADTTKVNLAYIIEDAMQIYIPNKTESKDNLEYLKQDAGDNIIKESKTETTKDNKININTATQAELENLPGIGPSIAIKIVEYRKKIGKFNRIDDIKNVNGLGDSKYNDIKEKIKI